MKHSLHIIIILAITFLACGSSEKQASNADSSDTIKAETDTMSVQPPHPPFSPGRAKVRATVEKIVANDEDVHLYIVVDRTLEYGPATPSLPGGQSVKVDASTFEKNAGEKFRTLKEGEQFTLLIGYTRSLGNESRNWTLQQIETDSTNN